MTVCGAIGALMVGGRVVGQLRCGLEAGHDAPVPVWHVSVPVEKRIVSPSYPSPLRYLDGTPHRVVLEWAPEHEVDLDLFDPAERFDVDVPFGNSDARPCQLCGKPCDPPCDR